MEVAKFSEDPMPGGTSAHLCCLPLPSARRWVTHPSVRVRLGYSDGSAGLEREMKGPQLQERRCARLELKQK